MKQAVDVEGRRFEVEADLYGAEPRVRIDGREVVVEASWMSARELSLSLDGRRYDVQIGAQSRDRTDVVIDGKRLQVGLGRAPSGSGRGRGRAFGGLVVATMPGKVVAVLVEAGAVVAEGQGVVVVEAMKMENELQAPSPGIVRKVHVKPGQIVEGDALLVEIEEAP